MFFSTSFSLKIVDKMMQSTNLCVILRVRHKNVSFLAVFTWFLILDKIQDGGQDNDHIWWRHRPPAAPSPIKYISFCWEDQRLDLGQNRFEILQLIKNSGEGFYQFPPLLLVQRWGVTLRVRPRVKYLKLFFSFFFQVIISSVFFTLCDLN